MGDFMEFDKDEFGFVLDEERILESDEYKNLSVSDKNKLIMRIIKKNNNVFDKLNESKEIGEYEFSPSESNNKSTKQDKDKVRPNINIDYNSIESANSTEELLLLLPKKDDVLFDDKIKLIKCYLSTVIDTYNNLIYVNPDDDMLDYLRECKEELQEKFLKICDYADVKPDLEIERQDEVNIIYLKSKNGNLVLQDLLDEDIEKYSSYSVLINSIFNQNFKNVKRFNDILYSMYEVRNDQQRVIFDFVNKNTIIILQAFTKKFWNTKKYRLNLRGRIEKYISIKNNLKEVLDNNENKKALLEDASKDSESIFQLLETKSKTLVKRGRNGRVN